MGESAGFKIAKTYTFESPRVGNKAFDAFSDSFSRRLPVFRITHHYDPVVHLPPIAMGYYHVGTEVYYDGNGKHQVCTGLEDDSCSKQFWNLASLLLFHRGDHCTTSL